MGFYQIIANLYIIFPQTILGLTREFDTIFYAIVEGLIPIIEIAKALTPLV